MSNTADGTYQFMTMPHRGIKLVESENTPVVQKYLGLIIEYLEKGKLHDKEGPLRSALHDEGHPDKECNLPFFKYSSPHPKYFWTTGVFSDSTKFIPQQGIVINW